VGRSVAEKGEEEEEKGGGKGVQKAERSEKTHLQVHVTIPSWRVLRCPSEIPRVEGEQVGGRGEASVSKLVDERVGGGGSGMAEDDDGPVVELVDRLRRRWRDGEGHGEVVIVVGGVQGVVNVPVDGARVSWDGENE
jgi:hypothetical protein